MVEWVDVDLETYTDLILVIKILENVDIVKFIILRIERG